MDLQFTTEVTATRDVPADMAAGETVARSHLGSRHPVYLWLECVSVTLFCASENRPMWRLHYAPREVCC